MSNNRYCFWCNAMLDPNSGLSRLSPTVDHIFPRSQGGTDKSWNTVNSCRQCNEVKADLGPVEWAYIRAKHYGWRNSTRRGWALFSSVKMVRGENDFLMFQGKFQDLFRTEPANDIEPPPESSSGADVAAAYTHGLTLGREEFRRYVTAGGFHPPRRMVDAAISATGNITITPEQMEQALKMAFRFF